MMKCLIPAIVVFMASPAYAESRFSFYSGLQNAPPSRVIGNDPLGVGPFDFMAGWDGNSLKAPLYYGLRGMWWLDSNLGIGLDFTHSKAYADDATLNFGTSGGFQILEFSDGLNNLTLNFAYRWPKLWNEYSPYVGGGAGIIIPHAEIKSNHSVEETRGYQLGGITLATLGGVSYALNAHWDLFAEYKFTYSNLAVDINGGGELKTQIMTNALNIGLSYSFRPDP